MYIVCFVFSAFILNLGDIFQLEFWKFCLMETLKEKATTKTQYHDSRTEPFETLAIRFALKLWGAALDKDMVFP